MKTLALGLSLVVATLFASGCGDDEETPAPAPVEVIRRTSTLERKLTTPVSVPDSAIGGTIDAIVRARESKLVSHPLPNLGPNGAQCNITRYDDADGVEKMRRERCTDGADSLDVGVLAYRDRDHDGKIDEISDSSDAGWELYDDDGDGRADRIVESVLHISPPVALGDFGADVTISAHGTISSRTREDRDHDGRFDVESVIATTGFEIHSIAP